MKVAAYIRHRNSRKKPERRTTNEEGTRRSSPRLHFRPPHFHCASISAKGPRCRRCRAITAAFASNLVASFFQPLPLARVHPLAASGAFGGDAYEPGGFVFSAAQLARGKRPRCRRCARRRRHPSKPVGSYFQSQQLARVIGRGGQRWQRCRATKVSFPSNLVGSFFHPPTRLRRRLAAGGNGRTMPHHQDAPPRTSGFDFSTHKATDGQPDRLTEPSASPRRAPAHRR